MEKNTPDTRKKRSTMPLWLGITFIVALCAALMATIAVYSSVLATKNNAYNKLKKDIEENNNKPLYARILPWNEGLEIINMSGAPFDACTLSVSAVATNPYGEIVMEINHIIYPGVDNSYSYPYASMKSATIKGAINKDSIKGVKLRCATDGATREAQFDLTSAAAK